MWEESILTQRIEGIHPQEESPTGREILADAKVLEGLRVLNLSDAWNVLGTDPADVVKSIRLGVTPEEKVQIAEKELEKARAVARKLMATHHPDRNPGDVESATRFRRVIKALSIIEEKTASMRAKMESGSTLPTREFFIIVEK